MRPHMPFGKLNTVLKVETIDDQDRRLECKFIKPRACWYMRAFLMESEFFLEESRVPVAMLSRSRLRLTTEFPNPIQGFDPGRISLRLVVPLEVVFGFCSLLDDSLNHMNRLA
ncbi:hypothetical protein KCV00_g400, partial [Aureobasidium melanogenum]